LKQVFCVFLFFFLSSQFSFGDNSSILLQKGWDELVKDNDTAAFKYFGMAYETARSEKDFGTSAIALLNMGICSYGASYSLGLHYCLLAMDEFKKIEISKPREALTGRSKCLQLISTINSRQGKYREAIALSKEAMAGFSSENDTTGYLGLIYNSLGDAYGFLNMPDSSEYFHRNALQERLLTKKWIYLPGSFCSVAAIEQNKGNKEQSKEYFDRALFIADSMGNRQAQVLALLGIGKWYLHFGSNEKEAEEVFLKAKSIASDLSDKSFYINSLNQLLLLKKALGNFEEALAYANEIQKLKDTLATWEKERVTKSLEVQFDVAEKNRQLSIVQEEKNIATLTNYILWGTLGFLILIATAVILFLKRINKSNKQLLKTKEELSKITEEQKKLKEQQMQNEIEFKESQLSALAVQMLQKNELLHEMKEQLEKENDPSKGNPLFKIINKGLNQDKEWTDFNSYFESINKNFYTRLKLEYPEISPNDLKICALIKLNLSIKEMAEILNISPDSVKTARYRLRKKLQLNSEDNLTDFILNLK
jgi:DNA-binding CsgD family transcriptional regulator